MSTRNERDAGHLGFLPRPRPPPRRSAARLRAPQHAHQQEGGDAEQEAAGGRRHRRGQRRPRRARSIGRGSASTGSGRTSASCSGSGRARLGTGEHTRAANGSQSVRSYTRYFLTISPPIASMARFIALLVSRIQPISPHFTRVVSAMSKCSA